jgi:selenocysteine lyase/cysteine desulfurase
MIASQRHLFDIPRDVAYINCAYLSPFLKTVRAAGERGIQRKSEPWTIKRDDFFADVERARAAFAKLLGTSPLNIAITPSTSYSIAVAAKNLPFKRGQTAVVPEAEHASNVYAWMQLARERGGEIVTAARPESGDFTAAILECIDRRTAVVAVPQCHWSDGLWIDLVAVGARAREVGAALVVDVTQALGAAPFDLAAVRPDFLACSAYKWLLCPYSLGFLYVAPHWQNGAPLELHGFNRANAFFGGAGKGYPEEFAPGACRYDVGERSNFIHLPMAILALEQLVAWGPANIAATLAPYTRRLEEIGRSLGFAAPPQGCGAPHLTGLRFPGGMPDRIEEKLAAKGVYVSVRGPALRLSPHLYNDDEDLAQFGRALQAVI